MPFSDSMIGRAVGGGAVTNSIAWNTSGANTGNPCNLVFAGSLTNTRYTFATWFRRQLPSADRVHTLLSGSGGSLEDKLEIRSIAQGQQLEFTIYPGGSSTPVRVSNRVFRDYCAWYHIVVAFDSTLATAFDRVKIWINGVRMIAADFSTNAAIPLNYASYFPLGHVLGQNSFDFQSFQGNFAETCFIIGSAHDAEDFGEFNDERVWVPIDVTTLNFNGGYYLTYKDSTNLGRNYAGGPHLTKNGTPAQSRDTPQKNIAIPNINDLLKTSTGLRIGNAGRKISFTSTNDEQRVNASHLVRSGKYYWEVTYDEVWSTFEPRVGIHGWGNNAGLGLASTGFYAHDSICIDPDLTRKHNGVNLGLSGTNFGNGDICMIAFDADNNKVWFGRNGTWLGIGTQEPETNTGGFSVAANPWGYFPAVGDNHSSSPSSTPTVTFNFGQDPFVYTVPSGFSQLSSATQPNVDIIKPSDYFSTHIYIGNGTSLDVQPFDFDPDFVWIKNLDSATGNHWIDSVRGAQLAISSNSSDVENNHIQGLTAFLTGGFSVGNMAAYNTHADALVAVCWREDPLAGFDIVGYVGNGAAGRNIAHNLGEAPSVMTVKNRDVTTSWVIYFSELAVDAETDFILFDGTALPSDSPNTWNDTPPSSTEFTVGIGQSVNGNGNDIIAYLFREVPGFSAFRRYTGNGNADGPFINLGFKPRLFIIKEFNPVARSWRSFAPGFQAYVGNPRNLSVHHNLGDVLDADADIDVVSNGVKIRSTLSQINTSGAFYLLWAWAEHPYDGANASPGLAS